MDREYFRGDEKWMAPSGWPFHEEENRFVPPAQKRPKVLVNILLFVLTVATTLLAGAMQQGVNPLQKPLQIVKGVPFSAALLFILLAHEMGHYYFSKRYRIDATLPYFIPAPTLIGTFGAVIKMRSPVHSKKALFDIGVAGPLAGLVVTIPILIAGFKLSQVKQMESPLEGGFVLGTSLLLSGMTKIIFGHLPEGVHVVLHPLAFAGWIGLLVTSLNLMPVGQLDGGHVAYALFGRKAEMISRMVIIVLLILGVWGASMWLFWAFLLILLIGVKHPPPLDYLVPLDSKRRWIGVVMLIIFIVTFIPFPFSTQ